MIARNADQPNSRWYSGAGLYRPVQLWTAGDKHILLNGVRIRTVSLEPAVVEIRVRTSAPGTVQLMVEGLPLFGRNLMGKQFLRIPSTMPVFGHRKRRICTDAAYNLQMMRRSRPSARAR